MAITSELYQALLAMDSYNRGYLPGLNLAAAGASTSQIGNAMIGTDALPTGAQAAGFFAQSYTLNGQKIISYRGTDDIAPFIYPESGNDPWNGYGTAAGLPFNDQARMAAEFFQAVTGTQTTNPTAGNAILTGHSLGGGLAGFIGAIYGKQAYLFDNMPFEFAAATAREAGLINSVTGLNILTDFYNGFAPPSVSIGTNLKAFATTGELLSATRSIGGQTTPVVNLDSYNTALGLVQKHSMALHVLLRYAADNALIDWQAIGLPLWNAAFNPAIANAALVGLPALSGGYTNEYKLLTALAYSTIDEGTRVFGDTGIRAMFNDANDIGSIVKLVDGSTTIKQAAGALSDILMQYAGQLAFGKVLQAASPAALNGIISVDPGKTVLTVDLSAAQWELGRLAGSGVPVIEGKKTLVDTAFGLAGSAVTDTRAGADWLWKANIPVNPDPTKQKDTAEIIDRISFAARNTGTTFTIPDRANAGDKGVTLFGSGGGNDTVNGSNGNDFIEVANDNHAFHVRQAA